VYRKIDLPYGHDAFLVYNNTLGNAMIDFLDGESKTRASDETPKTVADRRFVEGK